MKYTDQEIIKVIRLLMEGKGDDQQLDYWLDHELYGLKEVFNLIFHSKEHHTPEEILQKAREKNKPISL